MKITKILPITLICLSISAYAADNKTPIKTSSIDEAIAQEERTKQDKDRDLRSHPEVILKMLDVKKGDVVLDVFAGGGYYSELISRIVGDHGKVYLYNNKAYADYASKSLLERLKRIKFPQLLVHQHEVNNMNFPENSVDSAMIIMSYHDLFFDDIKNNWPKIDLKNFMGQIHTSLKKGGRFLIVDHNAQSGHGSDDTKSLHRIEKAFAIQSLENLGFKYIEESKILENPSDDMKKSVFDPSVKGKTNRFVLLFEKK